MQLCNQCNQYTEEDEINEFGNCPSCSPVSKYDMNPRLRAAIDAKLSPGVILGPDSNCGFCESIGLPRCRSHASDDLDYKRWLATTLDGSVVTAAKIATYDGSDVDIVKLQQALGDLFLGWLPYSQEDPDACKDVVRIKFPRAQAEIHDVHEIVKQLGLDLY